VDRDIEDPGRQDLTKSGNHHNVRGERLEFTVRRIVPERFRLNHRQTMFHRNLFYRARGKSPAPARRSIRLGIHRHQIHPISYQASQNRNGKSGCTCKYCS
jgi:hypothetical protein